PACSVRPRLWCGCGDRSRPSRGAPRRPRRSPAGSDTADRRRQLLAVAQRTVFANQQFAVVALFVGELEEDALALRVLEPLTVTLEELVRAVLALDADEQRLLIVDALFQLLR